LEGIRLKAVSTRERLDSIDCKNVSHFQTLTKELREGKRPFRSSGWDEKTIMNFLVTVAGHFAERHFAERHFAERHFADGRFAERTFCRMGILPNGQFAERTV
jgi:hypothetical protein